MQFPLRTHTNLYEVWSNKLPLNLWLAFLDEVWQNLPSAGRVSITKSKNHWKGTAKRQPPLNRWSVRKHVYTLWGYNSVTNEPEFCIHGSVHRNSILIRSNKMQQHAGIYLLQNHSTYFGCPSYPSSRVHKTFLQRDLLARLEEGCCSDTRGCCYSFMYSWWWVRWTSWTRRVILQ